MKTRATGFTVLKTAFLLLVSAVILVPFLHMIAVSLSGSLPVLRNQVYLLPKEFSLSTYAIVLRDSSIYAAYKNTLIYVLAGTAMSLLVTSSGAFALSKGTAMPGHKLFTALVVVCMFFSGGMIPTYLVVQKIGLVDRRLAMILPEAVSMFNFMIMVALFRSLPKDLEDQGCIDGLSELGNFWYIALPLSKAALATIGLFYAVSIWNDFYSPLVYLTSKRLFPLTIILRNMIIVGEMEFERGAGGKEYIVLDSLKYATLIVTVLPIMCVYPFLQRHFVKGILMGSLKG